MVSVGVEATERAGAGACVVVDWACGALAPCSASAVVSAVASAPAIRVRSVWPYISRKEIHDSFYDLVRF